MQSTDDTIRTGKQASEDTHMALVEAGAVPHCEWHGDQPPAEVDPGSTVIVHRIARATAEEGGTAGALQALWLLRNVPKGAEGLVVLSFDGWADDPRELFQIPAVVEFCQGMLYGAGAEPSDTWARNILAMLVDERNLGLLDDHGEVVEPDALNVPGQLWLVAHAFPDIAISVQGDGFLRHLDANIALHQVLINGV